MAKADITGRLNLDSTGFQRGIQRAKKGIAGFRKSLGGTSGILASLFSVAALKRGVEYIKQMENAAKLSGLASEEFQKFSFATKTVGIEQEKAADILKDVSDKVGDFLATGAGPMADFFENIAPKVGVTADEFKNLSGKDALQLYVSSLEKANVSQNEMTFYMEAIASDATALLPLLLNNGEALDNLANKAEKVGAVIDEKSAKQIKNMGDSFDQAGKVGLSVAAKAFNAGQKAFEGFFAVIESARTGNNIIFEMHGNVDELSDSTQNLTRTQKTQIERQQEINRLVAEAIGQTNDLLPTLKELAKLEKIVADEKKKRAKFQEELTKKTQDQFIIEKELESLRLRAAGENAAADALDSQIEKMREAIHVSEKYGISLMEAAKLVQKLSEKDQESGMLEKIQQIELAILRAQARGNDEAVESLQKRLELAQRIMEIMAKGASFEEAKALAAATGSNGGGRTSGTTRGTSGTTRGKITTGKITSIGSGTRESRFGAAPTMEERERAAGLYLAGNDPMSGRRPSGTSADEKKAAESAKDTDAELKEQTKILTTIKEEIQKNP